MKTKSFLYEALYFLMNSLLVYPLALIAQLAAFPGDDRGTGFLIFSPLLVIYLLSRITRHIKKIPALILMFVFSFLLPALFPLILLDGFGIHVFVFSVFMGISGLVFFLETRKRPAPLLVNKFFVGCAFYLVMGLAYMIVKPDGYAFITIFSTILFLCLSLFSLNTSTLNQSLYVNTAELNAGRLPAGMRRGNIILIVAFMAVSMIITCFDALRGAFAWLVDVVIAGFWAVVYFIASLPSYVAYFAGSPLPDDLPYDDYVPTAPNEDPYWFRLLMFVLAIAAIIALFIFFVHCIVVLVRKAKAAFPDFLAFLAHSGRKDEPQGYEDHTEELFDWSIFTQAQAERFKNFRTRFARKPKFSDQATNRDRVRFSYRLLLKRACESRPNAATMTPEELSREKLPLPISGETLERFAGIYNSARYSRDEVPSSAASEAKLLYDELGGK